uniref:Uncharacterized protein n=1 Tax=Magallana gigas TaxID=29159 RepID=A0A8W8JEX1_MAGGI
MEFVYCYHGYITGNNSSRTCWILLIAFLIQQTLRQMSCSTQMIQNSDVISSKISHGTSKTAEWIVTQSENCNPTSTKVAIGRLWSEYEKLRKNKSKTDGSRKFTEFLETEFAPPALSKTADNDQQRTTITELQTALKEKDDQIAYLIEQLQEGDETRVIHLFDKKEKAFTPELHLCVYSLLEHNVPSTQIGPTIKACLKLAGKEPDRLPSPSTVANMNIQRLCLVKKQLQDELPEKINTTLHTDETSKVGIKYGGFSVRDEEGNYFALGLREMATKSAQNTLDTFKEILQDIADTRKETHPQSAGNEILCNIQNTMSDRAATELKFNELLESYREEVLPQVRADYNTMNDEEKETVSRLNNFFCGLHGLVHMANAAQK